MLSLAGNVKGKRILDIGCGFGKASRMLKEQGASYVLGIDASERMMPGNGFGRRWKNAGSMPDG